MNSVRIRLLVLALAPMVLLMPLLLFIGMARWTADYDKVLIANVESDLRIAEQYLARIMATTGDELRGVAESVEFARHHDLEPGAPAYLDQTRDVLGLDFLYFLKAEDLDDQWPVIVQAEAEDVAVEIDIFSDVALAEFGFDLADRARIKLIETEAAVPTDRSHEDRGMVVHAAAAVDLAPEKGVLVGGILLNRNLEFIDTINELVYLNAETGGDRQGTATLFLEDVRISTNVRLFEDVRALGTRVSAVVRGAVLDDGKTWLNRAFVVNDWYISGYLPIVDSFENRVGMLYVGFLESPFSAAKQRAYLWMFGAFAAVVLLSSPVFLWLAKGIFAPLERMTQTMQRVGRGDLSARNRQSGVKGEIGQVADHLDGLLDQVQDRDQKLRAWADELNERVDDRTSELRDANEKLEETYRQLIMSEKLASIGEITAGVAHEINNPVAVIQGNVDVMRDTLGTSADDVGTELGLIDQQIGRIQSIVGKLLKFAKPGEFADMDETVALGPVLRDCLVLVDHLIVRNKIEVETHFEPVPDVRIDPGEMQQVVINLIINATQAMGHSGRLSLRLGPQNGGAMIEVADTGPGIPPDKIDTVFDPFFSTKQAEGTGLGLSISQSIIRRAGGLISVKNRDDGGAVFCVWLPLAQ